MTKPAVWNDDPECGHDVACAYQTHYCSYIRVPRLLTLQAPQISDELWLITAYQWYELWFKVLLTDLRTALADDGKTYETVKLLRRGIELFRLFDTHADLSETIILRELGLTHSIGISNGRGISEPLTQISHLSRQLPRLEPLSLAGLGETVREYRARLEGFRARYQKLVRATIKPSPPVPLARREQPRQARGNPPYAEWLRLAELLALQDGVKSAWTEEGAQPTGFWKPESISVDENMFVIVHQCSELYFQVILDQIDRAIPAMLHGDIVETTRLMRHVVLVQRLLAQQIRFPATMLPLDFLRFRHQQLKRDGKVLITGLSPASGSESYQFREIEIVSGLRDDPVFQNYLAGSEQLPIHLLTPRQAERLEQPTLPEAFRHAVEQRGIQRLDDIFTPANVPNPHADLAQLADTLIEFDEFFRLWRLTHVGMVEKMIGAKSGTGFLGPEYLMETAGIRIQKKNRIFAEPQVRPRFFEDLWAVRTRMGSY